MLLEASSGPVMPAEQLYRYTPAHQERLFRMAEASTTDESERRTATVKSTISTTRTSSIVQAILFALCVAASAVSFWVFSNKTAGAVFLSYPVLLFLSGLRWNLRRRPKND